uniref:Response regulatory domain-containing protein n=1 Tax=Dunaliella tertiolecta TaxID=3047 RepID=A0A7S3R4Z1_DUNTE
MTKLTHYEVHNRLCILSIDDDAVNLLVIEQLLAQEGWRVVSAQDGEEALEFLTEEDTWPDFIFLDYQMNVGDSGDEICRKLRNLFGPTPVPIVMCTAMGEGSEALRNCREAGATDFLLKPFERGKMLEKVHLHCPHKVAPRPSPPQAANIVKAQQQAPPKPSRPQEQEHAPEQRAAQGGPDKAQSVVLQFCTSIGLEYCGKVRASMLSPLPVHRSRMSCWHDILVTALGD